jgi:Flp pilus assembly protein TadD
MAVTDAQAYLGAGLKLIDLDRYSEASKEFELALLADPGLVEARYHLAVSYFRLHRFPDARQQFERVQATGYRKDWVTYYLARIDLLDGNLEAAVRGLESLKGPQPLQDELYYLGLAYLKLGQPQTAVAFLQREVAFNARDFRAYNLLGRAYAKLGRTVESERAFQESEGLHAYYLQGNKDLMECQTLLQSGQVASAWTLCGPILQTDDIDKLVGAGMLFGKAGAHDHALVLFRKAEELDPDSPEVNYDLALTLFQMKEYSQARKFVEGALLLRPDFFEALALNGSLLYLLHEDAAALAVLQRAHKLRPEDAGVRHLLALLERTPSK